MKRRATAVALGAALSLPALGSEAQAAPDDGYALSDDAALNGGTAVAHGEDPASVWFNPGVAARVGRLRAQVQINAYALRRTVVRDGIVARTDDDVTKKDVREQQLQVVPSAFTLGMAIPRTRLAVVLSLHNNRFANGEARARLSGVSDDGEQAFTQSFNSVLNRRRYHAGATLGWAPSPRFRLGITLGGAFDRDIEYLRFFSRVQSTAGPAEAYLIGDVDFASRLLGLETAIGIQGQVSERVHLGASVRTPAAVVWHRAEGGETASAQIVDETGAATIITEEVVDGGDDVPRYLSPWRVMAGIAVDVGRGHLALDAEAAPALRSGRQQVRPERSVWNVAIGGSGHVSDRVILGGGLFTDRTYRRQNDLFPTAKLDRWGGSLGVRLLTPVKLDRSERVDTLVLEATVALRYAVGVGTTNALELRYPNVPSGVVLVQLNTDSQTRALQHLAAVHVGTGLRF